MGWISTDFERYDTENEVKSEFYETVLYEVPSGLADMQKCVRRNSIKYRGRKKVNYSESR